VIAYVDSSVLLRLVLGSSGALAEWRSVDRAVVSALVEVECLRTIDRLRLVERLSDKEVSRRLEAVFRVLDACEVVDVTAGVLARAAQPSPTALGTLDAIHLASAVLWREATGEEIVMATHDAALVLAARAAGLQVIGA
jgi:predicted nucleic acid-binding protein